MISESRISLAVQALTLVTDNVNLHLFALSSSSTGSSEGWGGCQQFLADLLALLQPRAGGPDYAHHINTGPSRFWTFRRLCSSIVFESSVHCMPFRNVGKLNSTKKGNNKSIRLVQIDVWKFHSGIIIFVCKSKCQTRNSTSEWGQEKNCKVKFF